MGYPKDLDEYTDEELRNELALREHRRNLGYCDYCGRSTRFSGLCKFPERHKEQPLIVTSASYLTLAQRTSASQNATRIQRLLHAGLGMCTEAGEFVDAIKKHLFYRKEIDTQNITEEIGDHCWYLAEAMNALGVSFDDVLTRNIAKLKIRYPEKFTEHLAVNRDLEQERKAFD